MITWGVYLGLTRAKEISNTINSNGRKWLVAGDLVFSPNVSAIAVRRGGWREKKRRFQLEGIGSLTSIVKQLVWRFVYPAFISNSLYLLLLLQMCGCCKGQLQRSHRLPPSPTFQRIRFLFFFFPSFGQLREQSAPAECNSSERGAHKPQVSAWSTRVSTWTHLRHWKVWQ